MYIVKFFARLIFFTQIFPRCLNSTDNLFGPVLTKAPDKSINFITLFAKQSSANKLDVFRYFALSKVNTERFISGMKVLASIRFTESEHPKAKRFNGISLK